MCQNEFVLWNVGIGVQELAGEGLQNPGGQGETSGGPQ